MLSALLSLPTPTRDLPVGERSVSSPQENSHQLPLLFNFFLLFLCFLFLLLLLLGFLCFDRGSHSAIQTGLKCTIPLPWLPN